VEKNLDLWFFEICFKYLIHWCGYDINE
jgi:hypothetical protein